MHTGLTKIFVALVLNHTWSLFMSDSSQKITTFLMFEGAAEEAMTFYLSLFDDAEVLHIQRYGPGEQGAEGTVQHAAFTLAGQQFMCIDGGTEHAFTFTPSVSLFVQCESDDEITRLYTTLAEGGEPLMPLGSYGFSQQFGWVNDRYGVSWQLTLA